MWKTRTTLQRLLSALSLALASCGDASVQRDQSPAMHADASATRDAAAGPRTIEIEAIDAGAYAFPCLGATPPARSDTFESVYLEILCTRGCVDSYCHGSRGAWGGLDLASSLGQAYAALVGQPAGDLRPVDARPTCVSSPLARVTPYEPERSLLYLKLSRRAPCGSAMPPDSSGRTPLAAEQLEHVRRWIVAGAPLSDAP